MAKPKLLNVRKHLEHIQLILNGMFNDDGKYPPCGKQLPLLYIEELKKISFLNRLILSEHKRKNTRKDIYVNRG